MMHCHFPHGELTLHEIARMINQAFAVLQATMQDSIMGKETFVCFKEVLFINFHCLASLPSPQHTLIAA